MKCDYCGSTSFKISYINGNTQYMTICKGCGIVRWSSPSELTKAENEIAMRRMDERRENLDQVKKDVK